MAFIRMCLVSLVLFGCGSSGSESKDYLIRVFAVNVDCVFAEQVVDEASERFYAAGIPFAMSEFNCVSWDKAYAFGEKEQALTDLEKVFGSGHFIVPKFGIYFDGVQRGSSSIGSAVVGRLNDSAELFAHEVAHQFGASHDFSDCNIMGYFPCGYPAKFNIQAIKEMMR